MSFFAFFSKRTQLPFFSEARTVSPSPPRRKHFFFCWGNDFQATFFFSFSFPVAQFCGHFLFFPLTKSPTSSFLASTRALQKKILHCLLLFFLFFPLSGRALLFPVGEKKVRSRNSISSPPAGRRASALSFFLSPGRPPGQGPVRGSNHSLLRLELALPSLPSFFFLETLEIAASFCSFYFLKTHPTAGLSFPFP